MGNRVRNGAAGALLVTALTLAPCFVFAGGAQGGGASSSTAFTGEGAPKGYAVPVSQGGELTERFTIFRDAIVMSPDDTPMQRALKEKTGIDFVVRGIQATDAQTAINLMLASGEKLADLLVVGRSSAVRAALIDSGKVLETSFLYNSKSLTTIPNIPAKIKKFVTEADGKLWVIPGRYAEDPDDPFPGWTLDAFWIRQDIMEQAGVTERDMATLDGFEAALRKFKALKDPAGNPMIPLSFMLSGHQEKLVPAMFGVDMAGGVSGMPPVMEINGKRVFAYENPDYLEAYKWLNKLYTEGLLDLEVTTQNAERFQEKLENGMFAGYVGANGQGRWDYWKDMKGPEDNPAKWYMYPFQSPKVTSKTKQAVNYINPYPSFDIFISRDTKRLNAAVNFLEWGGDHTTYWRSHEAENGPEGTTWWFTDAEKRLWQFEPGFEKDRSSGDPVLSAKASPQIYQVTTSSKRWYPWFNQAASNLAPGNFLTPKYCEYIGNTIVNHRVIRDTDMVQAPIDGVIASNLPTLNQVVDEYTAKMIMAKSTADCETVYKEFLRMLDTRANWSGMKAEWEKLYAASR